MCSNLNQPSRRSADHSGLPVGCVVSVWPARGSRVCQSLTDRGLVWTTELKLGVKNTSQPTTPSVPRGRRRGGSSGSHRGPHGTLRARRLEPESPVASRLKILGGSGSPPAAIGETMAAFSAAAPPTSPADASANHLPFQLSWPFWMKCAPWRERRAPLARSRQNRRIERPTARFLKLEITLSQEPCRWSLNSPIPPRTGQ